MSNFDVKFTPDTLTPSAIQRLNNIKRSDPSQKILVDIPNTKGISSEMLKTLDPGVSIRIAGAYDEERVKRLGGVKYSNGETGQYYTDAVIYSRNEVITILSAMEKIEKGFEGQDFTELEKLVYIYDKLKSGIMYDPKHEGKKSSETRSLRGFITRETVCAGYAVMFKEMLDRQGIECHYVAGKSSNGRKTCLEYSFF